MRQVLTDGTARYFNTSKATHWDESTTWNGSNHVSDATGSQWDHERLYRTKSGLWIIHAWSQWQGSTESWEETDDERAAAWLVTNGHDSHKACASAYAALDLDNGPEGAS
jgi:hypothetical protein